MDIIFNIYGICLVLVMVTFVQTQEPYNIEVVLETKDYVAAFSSCNGGSLGTFTNFSSEKRCIANYLERGEIWILEDENEDRRRRKRDSVECPTVNIISGDTDDRNCKNSLPYICYFKYDPPSASIGNFCPTRSTSLSSSSLRTTISTSASSVTMTTTPNKSSTSVPTHVGTTTATTTVTSGSVVSSPKEESDDGVIIAVTLACIFLAGLFAALAFFAFKRRAKLPKLKFMFHNKNYAKTEEKIMVEANENSNYFCLEKSVYAEITDPVGAEERVTSSDLSPPDEGRSADVNITNLEDRTYHHLRENDRQTDPSSNYSTHTFEMSPGEYAHTSEVSHVAAQMINNDEYTHANVDSNGN